MEFQAASDSGVGRWEKVRLCSQTVLILPSGTNKMHDLSIRIHHRLEGNVLLT